MKFLWSLFFGLSTFAAEAEDVSYLRRLRKLTSPAIIWSSKSLDFTIIEDEDVTDIEDILQNLETTIEKRQKDAQASPYLVIYSLDERTTTESFAEGRDFLRELPDFMKKGSTHLYPHCLARKKKPNTSQWAAILDTLESDLQNASEAKLIVLSDSETPGTQKNGVTYFDHAMSDKTFDEILKSMANAKVLVIEASIESYPEGGWINHIDRLVSSTERDVILFMAVTSPLPSGAIHGLLPSNESRPSRKSSTTMESGVDGHTLAAVESSVLADGFEQGTGGEAEIPRGGLVFDEDAIAGSEETTEFGGITIPGARRRLQAVKEGDKDPVVLRIKP